MTPAEAVAVAVTKIEGVHRSAQNLAADIHDARKGLAVAVGAQSPLRLT